MDKYLIYFNYENSFFPHNVYRRHKQIIKTIQNNRQFINDEKIVVVSNDIFFSFINYTKIANNLYWKFNFRQNFY